MDNQKSREQVREELKQRAIALAQVPPEIQHDLDQIDVTLFHLASETYALETRFIREVWPLSSYLPLPNTPPFILGIANVHGEICSVVDLKNFFSLPASGITDLNKLIILEKGEMVIGVLADDVFDTRTLLKNNLSSAGTWQGIDSTYLAGVTEDRLIVLDAEPILNDKRLIVNDRIET